MSDEEPDFEISEASISGTRRRDDILGVQGRSRRRAIRVTTQIGIIVVIALVAAFFIVRAPLQSYLLAQRGSPPTSVPRPLPKIVIATDVTFGTLTVNGKAMPFTPNDPNHPLPLSQEHAVITLNAPPFQPISCTVNNLTFLPSRNSGRCVSDGDENGLPVLDMNLTLADLPPLPREQFDTYLAQKLTQLNAIQANVPAKEHYTTGLDPHGVPIVAISSSPLRAQLLVTPQQSATDSNRTRCSDAICPGYMQIALDATPPHYLDLQLQVGIGWQFYNSTSQQLGAYQLTGDSTRGTPLGIDFQMTYDAATGWHDLDVTNSPTIYSGPPLIFQLGDMLCQSGQSFILNMLQQIPADSLYRLSGTYSALSGCFITAVNTSDNQPPPDITQDPASDTKDAWFLVHFGALLAANAKAHTLLPQLPQAGAQEIAEVQKAVRQQFGN